MNGNFYDEDIELSELMSNLPPLIIGIDGLSGAGKTSYGRFLAFFYNVTLIETDLYVNGCPLNKEYDFGCIKRLIDSRINLERPIIVEGICVVDILSEIDIEPDYLIRIINNNQPDGEKLDLHVQAYERRIKRSINSTKYVKHF